MQTIGLHHFAYRTQACNLGPSINDGWEAGVKFAPLPWLDGRVGYWEQRASGKVARVLGIYGLPDPSGLGSVEWTLRKGYDVQLQAKPSPRTTVWAAYSHQIARITAPDPSAPATHGKEIENVPHYLWSAGLDWQPDDSWKLSAWANGQGDYYVERTNTLGRFGQAVLLNVGATYRWSPAIDLQVQVKNLANRKTVYAWYDSGSSGFSPGDGRGVFASVGWRF